ARAAVAAGEELKVASPRWPARADSGGRGVMQVRGRSPLTCVHPHRSAVQARTGVAGSGELHPHRLCSADEGVGHFGWCISNLDTALLEDGDLRGRGVLGAADDGTGVAHAAAGGGRGTGDETCDRLLAVQLDPTGGLDLGVAADFADHDDAMGVGVVIEHLDHVEMRRAVHGITPDADARRLADAAGRELEDRLVGEGAGARDDADVALLVNVAWRDADAAASVRLRTGAGSNDAGAVRADQARAAAFHRALHTDHVLDGNA